MKTVGHFYNALYDGISDHDHFITSVETKKRERDNDTEQSKSNKVQKMNDKFNDLFNNLENLNKRLKRKAMDENKYNKAVKLLKERLIGQNFMFYNDYVINKIKSFDNSLRDICEDIYKKHLKKYIKDEFIKNKVILYLCFKFEDIDNLYLETLLQNNKINKSNKSNDDKDSFVMLYTSLYTDDKEEHEEPNIFTGRDIQKFVKLIGKIYPKSDSPKDYILTKIILELQYLIKNSKDFEMEIQKKLLLQLKLYRLSQIDDFYTLLIPDDIWTPLLPFLKEEDVKNTFEATFSLEAIWKYLGSVKSFLLSEFNKIKFNKKHAYSDERRQLLLFRMYNFIFDMIFHTFIRIKKIINEKLVNMSGEYIGLAYGLKLIFDKVSLEEFKIKNLQKLSLTITTHDFHSKFLDKFQKLIDFNHINSLRELNIKLDPAISEDELERNSDISATDYSFKKITIISKKVLKLLPLFKTEQLKSSNILNIKIDLWPIRTKLTQEIINICQNFKNVSFTINVKYFKYRIADTLEFTGFKNLKIREKFEMLGASLPRIYSFVIRECYDVNIDMYDVHVKDIEILSCFKATIASSKSKSLEQSYIYSLSCYGVNNINLATSLFKLFIENSREWGIFDDNQIYKRNNKMAQETQLTLTSHLKKENPANKIYIDPQEPKNHLIHINNIHIIGNSDENLDNYIEALTPFHIKESGIIKEIPQIYIDVGCKIVCKRTLFEVSDFYFNDNYDWDNKIEEYKFAASNLFDECIFTITDTLDLNYASFSNCVFQKMKFISFYRCIFETLCVFGERKQRIDEENGRQLPITTPFFNGPGNETFRGGHLQEGLMANQYVLNVHSFVMQDCLFNQQNIYGDLQTIHARMDFKNIFGFKFKDKRPLQNSSDHHYYNASFNNDGKFLFPASEYRRLVNILNIEPVMSKWCKFIVTTPEFGPEFQSFTLRENHPDLYTYLNDNVRSSFFGFRNDDPIYNYGANMFKKIVINTKEIDLKKNETSKRLFELEISPGFLFTNIYGNAMEGHGFKTFGEMLKQNFGVGLRLEFYDESSSVGDQVLNLDKFSKFKDPQFFVRNLLSLNTIKTIKVTNVEKKDLTLYKYSDKYHCEIINQRQGIADRHTYRMHWLEILKTQHQHFENLNYEAKSSLNDKIINNDFMFSYMPNSHLFEYTLNQLTTKMSVHFENYDIQPNHKIFDLKGYNIKRFNVTFKDCTFNSFEDEVTFTKLDADKLMLEDCKFKCKVKFAEFESISEFGENIGEVITDIFTLYNIKQLDQEDNKKYWSDFDQQQKTEIKTLTKDTINSFYKKINNIKITNCVFKDDVFLNTANYANGNNFKNVVMTNDLILLQDNKFNFEMFFDNLVQVPYNILVRYLFDFKDKKVKKAYYDFLWTFYYCYLLRKFYLSPMTKKIKIHIHTEQQIMYDENKSVILELQEMKSQELFEKYLNSKLKEIDYEKLPINVINILLRPDTPIISSLIDFMSPFKFTDLIDNNEYLDLQNLFELKLAETTGKYNYDDLFDIIPQKINAGDPYTSLILRLKEFSVDNEWLTEKFYTLFDFNESNLMFYTLFNELEIFTRDKLSKGRINEQIDYFEEGMKEKQTEFFSKKVQVQFQNTFYQMWHNLFVYCFIDPTKASDIKKLPTSRINVKNKTFLEYLKLEKTRFTPKNKEFLVLNDNTMFEVSNDKNKIDIYLQNIDESDYKTLFANSSTNTNKKVLNHLLFY